MPALTAVLAAHLLISGVATAALAGAASPPDGPQVTASSDAELAAYADELIAIARQRRLAASRDWQVLLHYKPGLFGRWRSEAEGEGFFLAGRKGRKDPEAELEASLRALMASGPSGDDHAQCRFPARWAWLKAELSIVRVAERACPNFEIWKTGISAEAATLVYATAYLNSPASMYGHTFLRLSRSTGDGNPLLDYIVNFAADVDTENGLVYAFKGVTGLFPGRFYVMPYYVKVQEYSNMESRDLWEYELTLSPRAVERLVLHAWETRSTHFPYFFFTENCSYHLLALLEAADPTLHLTDEFGGWVIPADTVRAMLEKQGLIRRVAARPSLLSIMKSRKALLTGEEVRAAEAWLATPPPARALPEGASKARQAMVIDAAYEYFRFKEGLRAVDTDAFKRRERQLLLARGRLGVPPQEVATRPEVEAPELGHATARLSVGGGASDQAGGFATLAIRGAIHDYLDPGSGYPPDARLVMGGLRLRFEEVARVPRLDRLDALDIVSAAPLDRWVHAPSWKVWAGADNARELGCERSGAENRGWRCLYGGLVTGGGLAFRFGPRDALLMLLLAETDMAAGPAFAAQDYYRVGAGGEALLVGGTRDRWRFELGARYTYYLLGARGPRRAAHVSQSFMLSKSFALRMGGELVGSFRQAAGELVAFF